MQITIDGRNLEITGAIQDYIEKRLQKLKKYFPYLIDVHVVLFTQKIHQCVEVTIHANRYTIHGEEKSPELYSSIDLVIDKLDAQLKKYKDKLVHEKTRQPRPEKDLNLNISVFERETLEVDNPKPQVIHTKKLAIKPMSVDEAVMQMDLLDQDFLVFQNADSNGINILYRRKDENYGLIEPQLTA